MRIRGKKVVKRNIFIATLIAIFVMSAGLMSYKSLAGGLGLKVDDIELGFSNQELIKGKYLPATIRVSGGVEPYYITFGYISETGEDIICKENVGNDSTFQLEMPFVGEITYFATVTDAENKTVRYEEEAEIKGCIITDVTKTIESPAKVGDSIEFDVETKYEVDYRGTNSINMYFVNNETGEKECTGTSRYSGRKLIWEPKVAGTYTVDVEMYTYGSGYAYYSFEYVVEANDNVENIVETNENVATIYYKGFENPYIHYSINGEWTKLPGVLMEATDEVDGYTHKAVIDLGDAETVTACFNDGNNNWDSDYGKNYVFNKGDNYYSK